MTPLTDINPVLSHLFEMSSPQGKEARKDPDARILRVARRQHGVVSRLQATAAGHTAHSIHTRVKRGHWIRGRVDFFFEAHHLVVEIYGYEFHSSRESWQRDLSKENRFTLRGLRTLRFTWRQLVQEPNFVLGQVADGLGRNDLFDERFL